MDVTKRTEELERLFSIHHEVLLEDSKIRITPHRFKENGYEEGSEVRRNREEFNVALSGSEMIQNDYVAENRAFNYFTFSPAEVKRYDKAIFLLHGLNERSWKKYLYWAEYLVNKTGNPVVLFPIAFHMNRTPSTWINPHKAFPLVTKRKERIHDLKNSTFFNVALSSRLSEQPKRFYVSGLETVNNLISLITDIKQMKHPLFNEGAAVNLFGYSIGAFIAQVLLISNPFDYFTNSKLFMFCGGAVLDDINANARDILDSEANDRIHQYYRKDYFEMNANALDEENVIQAAFSSMLQPDVLRKLRTHVFASAKERIKAISLKGDSVVPTFGIMNALGNTAKGTVEELDFDYPYSHQMPFPLDSRQVKEPAAVNRSFFQVFDQAAGLLA